MRLNLKTYNSNKLTNISTFISSSFTAHPLHYYSIFGMDSIRLVPCWIRGVNLASSFTLY